MIFFSEKIHFYAHLHVDDFFQIYYYLVSYINAIVSYFRMSKICSIIFGIQSDRYYLNGDHLKTGRINLCSNVTIMQLSGDVTRKCQV